MSSVINERTIDFGILIVRIAELDRWFMLDSYEECRVMPSKDEYVTLTKKYRMRMYKSNSTLYPIYRCSRGLPVADWYGSVEPVFAFRVSMSEAGIVAGSLGGSRG